MASGYSDSDINALASGQSGVQCIQKPFTMHELQLKIAALTPSTVGPASLP
jgi:DNA-binding response OmpR family regulator